VFRHVSHEGLGTLALLLDKAKIPWSYVDTAQKGVEFPPIKNILGLVVMGGPMGVYQQKEFPFLTKEIRYLKRVITAKKPVLGVCLGSQLIARALGARVYPHRVKEIGWCPIQITAQGQNFFFEKPPKTSMVFQWHGDTFDIPQGAVRLATSPLCKNQAFRYGKNVLALQFHLEVDRSMIEDWLSQPGAESEMSSVGPKTKSEIRAQFFRFPALHHLASSVFNRFLSCF